MRTLLISSGGGGAHKALAKYYSDMRPEGETLTFNVDFLEQPIFNFGKKDNTKHVTSLKKLFNWLQSSGRAWVFSVSFLTLVFNSIVEFFLYIRTKRNMLTMLRKHRPTEIINAQPMNLKAIFRALDTYAKENPDQQITYKLCSTDYFSVAMPYWGISGIPAHPNNKPSNLSMTVTGPYSESVEKLKSKTPSWVKFDLKDPREYEIAGGFYDLKSSVRRVVYLDSGIGWERENITQASKILHDKDIDAAKFSENLEIAEHESITQTLGSQGSVQLAKQASTWFENKAKSGAKLRIFAGKAYDKTVATIKSLLSGADQSSKEEPNGDDKTITTQVFSLGQNRSIQVVPFCSVDLIKSSMVQSDTILVKPSGQSAQQSVQLALAAKERVGMSASAA
jgi:hypothetical protein